MFTYECVLLVALFSCPRSTPLIRESKPQSQTVALAWVCRPALLILCHDAEIIDRREQDHYLILPGTCCDDLAHLHFKYQEMMALPILEECNRFPSRQIINDFLSANRAYRLDLLKRLEVDRVHMEDIRLAIWETDQLYQIWDALRDARCDYYYTTVRRQALQNLKEMIGVEAFYHGTLPPYIPSWHIPRRGISFQSGGPLTKGSIR